MNDSLKLYRMKIFLNENVHHILITLISEQKYSEHDILKNLKPLISIKEFFKTVDAMSANKKLYSGLVFEGFSGTW